MNTEWPYHSSLYTHSVFFSTVSQLGHIFFVYFLCLLFILSTLLYLLFAKNATFILIIML